MFLSASQKAKNHLWVVLSDPIGNPAQVVLVSLSTLREGADTTVVISPGEHPFVGATRSRSTRMSASCTCTRLRHSSQGVFHPSMPTARRSSSPGCKRVFSSRHSPLGGSRDTASTTTCSDKSGSATSHNTRLALARASPEHPPGCMRIMASSSLAGGSCA